ncbi:MAG: hypothetical protein ACXAD7_08495 [Candidatus Kariarchaeaceae archaeon]|jgi:GTPase SAR1 family protein
MDYYILVTGLMSSGKSTLMNEYMHAFPFEDFTKPPNVVKFRGMEFEFIDPAFAINYEGNKYNFYELDAPTIQKWVQFIKMADAVMLVHNLRPKIVYGSPAKLMSAIEDNVRKNTPILLIANNSKSEEEAIENTKSMYVFQRLKESDIKIAVISSGERYFDRNYGVRIKMSEDHLKDVFFGVIDLIQKITKS